MLALIAGEGRLPELLMVQLDAQEMPYRLCCLDGHEPPMVSDRPVTRFRIETLGSFLTELANAGVEQVCLAGRIDRPVIDPALIDARTAPLVPRITAALQGGDGAALGIVTQLFEERGITVVSAQDIRPDLLPPAGVLTSRQPDAAHEDDATRGFDIIAAMAAVDVGQACVVADGQALAIEALPGTDRMLTSLAEIGDSDHGDWIARRMARARSRGGGILVKAAKPGQDRRVDLPTVGPDTIRNAHAAGLEGIVIEAGSVMVLDQQTTVVEADRLGLFLWVRA